LFCVNIWVFIVGIGVNIAWLWFEPLTELGGVKNWNSLSGVAGSGVFKFLFFLKIK
jgi:hypothetical protein